MNTGFEQDLRFVREAIEHSRRSVVVDALPIMIWAVITLIGIALTYLAPVLDSPWLWVGLIGLAWVATGWRVLGVRRRSAAIVLIERILATAWFALLTAMTVIGMAGVFSQALPPVVIPPVFAALFGIGFAVSSISLDRSWLLGVACAWWLGAILLFLLPPATRLAAYGVLIALLLLLPALIVHRRKFHSG